MMFGAPSQNSVRVENGELSTAFSTNVEKSPYEGPHPRWKIFRQCRPDEGRTLAYGRIEEQEKISMNPDFSKMERVDSRLWPL